METVAALGWDVVLFGECVYTVLLGETLPSAIATFLLSGGPGAVALGAFSPNGSAGTRSFWDEATRVGLRWVAVGAENLRSLELGQRSNLTATVTQPCNQGDNDSSAAGDGASRATHIYLFQSTDRTKPRDGWGADAGGGDDIICRGIEW